MEKQTVKKLIFSSEATPLRAYDLIYLPSMIIEWSSLYFVRVFNPFNARSMLLRIYYNIADVEHACVLCPNCLHRLHFRVKEADLSIFSNADGSRICFRLFDAPVGLSFGLVVAGSLTDTLGYFRVVSEMWARMVIRC
nr:AlNc14C681G12394 [Albugo laibachii Nc14]|eukprot:CCA27783.1 AlNc14C681G12394 [Albugo laibachii Nc14]